jgi:hypothetical protein
LLVLTGVTGLGELVAAPPEQRPTYIAADLAGLLEAHPTPAEDGDGAVVLGGWRATVDGGRLSVTGSGETGDWWRVCAVAGWRHLDASGEPADVDGVASEHD